MGKFKEYIRNTSYEYGFDLFGVTHSLPHNSIEKYKSWISNGYHGSMEFLKRHISLKTDPKNIMENAKSVLCFGAVYNPDIPYSVDNINHDKFYISRYAQNQDYHDVLRKKLYKLIDEIMNHFNINFKFRICIDSAPLLERSYSVEAGLGWIGKNGCIINKDLGSFIFLSEVLIDFDLPIDKPYDKEYCGNCKRCIEACPTKAILPNRTIDTTKCISSVTIENDNDIPDEIKDKANGFIYGCDVCQEVCPFNKNAPITRINEFKAREEILKMSPKDFEGLSKEKFNKLFHKNPVKRIKYENLMKNINWNLRNL